MKKVNEKNLRIAKGFFLLFVGWTILIKYVDVQAIGVRNTFVGFATFNGWFHTLTGTNMLLYTITDWLGLIPLCFVLSFAILGLVQLIKRKSFMKVDYDILTLGGFYIVVFAVYCFFEVFIVNYRPILIDGCLEASYPSSTTLLVMCVMPTTMMQLNKRIKNEKQNKYVKYMILLFVVFMVVGRLISGVHYFSDIVGGIFLSTSLVMCYRSINISFDV